MVASSTRWWPRVGGSPSIRRCSRLIDRDRPRIYFEGRGGETIGQYGKSKDHRLNCKQMIVSILETRPIYHKCDQTIRGHVFCSFLALVLLKELLARLEGRGWPVEWERLKDDLEAWEDITVDNAGKTFVLRTRPRGEAGKALQAAGVALGPTVRVIE